MKCNYLRRVESLIFEINQNYRFHTKAYAKALQHYNKSIVALGRNTVGDDMQNEIV